MASIITSCKSKNEIEYSEDPVTNIEALWEIITPSIVMLMKRDLIGMVFVTNML